LLKFIIFLALLQSPVSSASTADRISTPASSRRRLFGGPATTPTQSAASPVVPAAAPKVAETNDTESKKPSCETQEGTGPSPSVEKADNKPKRTGSLGLFFRKVSFSRKLKLLLLSLLIFITSRSLKFYHLASVRLQDLCNRLELYEEDLRKKIWTCFEYSVMNHTDLMQDRHLDQILMCAVYVICKVSFTSKNNFDHLLNFFILYR
jgi:Retinoblastoma-associated protein B domain